MEFIKNLQTAAKDIFGFEFSRAVRERRPREDWKANLGGLLIDLMPYISLAGGLVFKMPVHETTLGVLAAVTAKAFLVYNAWCLERTQVLK